MTSRDTPHGTSCPQRTECTPHGCRLEDCPHKGEQIYRMALKLVGEYNADKEKIAARGHRRIGEHFRTDEVTLAEQVVQLHNELLVARGEAPQTTDALRYRALRDSGIAVSAWQDVDGVHWAVNGAEYMNLDDGADALLKGKVK